MRIALVCACASALVASVCAQPYSHQKLGENLFDVLNGVLSENGVPAWSASLSTTPTTFDIYWITQNNNYTESILGSGSRETRPIQMDPNGNLIWEGRGPATSSFFDVFVNAGNVSASVLGSSRDALAFGFRSNGTPIWSGRGANNGNFYDVFAGSTNLSSSVLGSNRDAFPVSLAGDFLAWDGYGGNTSGLRDAFKTNLASSSTTNMSSGLGAGRSSRAIDVNTAGQMMWEGFGATTSNFNDVFVDAANVSSTPLGDTTRDAQGGMISEDGTSLWRGFGTATTNYFDVFRGSTNISRTPLGTADHDAMPVMVNAAGAALWDGSGANTSYYWDAVITAAGSTTAVNISRPTLGTNARDAYGLWLGTGSNVLWQGKSLPTTGEKYHLFFFNGSANTNLTMAATGVSVESFPLAINAAGQMLWGAMMGDGTFQVWLSTPKAATNLSGTVTMDGYAASPTTVNLTVDMINPFNNSVRQTASGALNGSAGYSANVNDPGLYNLKYSAPRFLIKRFSSVTLLGNVVVNLSLILGDVNGDNVIDDTDLALVLERFGDSTGDPVDLNGDGIVDDTDLAIVLENFGTSGD